MSRPLRRLLLLPGLLLLAAAAQAGPPRVVASIAPVYALVAGVMAGVAEPVLLLRGSASPHDYSLRPSDVRAINAADVAFWIGPALEGVLVKTLANAAQVRSVALLEAPGVERLPRRQGGAWGDHDHGHDHDPAHPDDADPHVWLDPRNAMAMTRHIAAVLGDLDPGNADRYRQNAQALLSRLEQLDQELAASLAPLKDAPYVVFHDAYHYFERRYGLHPLGAITVNPEQPPGARRIRDIRDRIRAGQARCVFSEPQFQPDLIATLLEGTGAGSGVLDPVGAGLEADTDAYFTLLRGLAGALRGCLGGAPTPP